jgi:antitoxin component of MazEF toxin-antitoxin module
VNLRADEGRIVVERPQPKSYRICELLASVTKANQHTEVDFGEPAGGEAW